MVDEESDIYTSSDRIKSFCGWVMWRELKDEGKIDENGITVEKEV